MAMYTAFFLLTILLVHLIPLSKTCLSDIDSEFLEYARYQLLDGSVRFSLSLFRIMEAQDQLKPESAGLFLSPYSVWSTLMVLYMGAKGQTNLELKYALGVGRSNKDVNLAAFSKFLQWNENNLVQQIPTYEMANRVFFQDGIAINQCIYEKTRELMSFVDFYRNPLHATSIINKWIDRETHHKIQNLIPIGDINSNAKIVIATAVYFEHSWLIQFDPRWTMRGAFTLMNNTEIEVNMMYLKDQFRYGVSEELDCTGLEMPYSGKDLSMLILLPNERQSLSALVERLISNSVQNFYEQMYLTKVEVSLPKFRLENSFELFKVLYREMGILTLFSNFQADLTGLSDTRDLFVDSVYHKSFINVNEEGKEKAATSSAIVSRKNLYQHSVPFVASHPFVFLIRDNRAKIILFAGTVKKPLAFGQS